MKPEGGLAPPSACGGYYLRASGGLVSDGAIPCKRWDCNNPTCSQAKLRYYYALFCNGLGVHNGIKIPDGENVVLITITTSPKKWSTPQEAWHKIKYAFKLFRQRIYLHYGKFAYVAVTEATKKGFPHIHLVCRGIADIPQGWHEEWLDENTGEWCLVRKQSDKKGRKYRILRYPSDDGRPTLSEMADASGFGWVCDIRKVDFDNSKGVANYIYKYLRKSLPSTQYPVNFRRVRYTKDWLLDDWTRPEKSTGTGLMVPFEDEVKILRKLVERESSGEMDAEAIITRLNELGPKKIARKLLAGLPIDLSGESEYS